MSSAFKKIQLLRSRIPCARTLCLFILIHIIQHHPLGTTAKPPTMRTLSAVFAAAASVAVCTAAAADNATWVVVTPTIDTIAAACSFTSATTGFVPGSASNAASAVLKVCERAEAAPPGRSQQHLDCPFRCQRACLPRAFHATLSTDYRQWQGLDSYHCGWNELGFGYLW